MALTGQTQSRLLQLPRELRDDIYVHLFQYGYLIRAPFPPRKTETDNPYDDAVMLKLRHRLPQPQGNAHPDSVQSEHCDPTWLLTCKQIFNEGTGIFTRSKYLEWVYDGGSLLPARYSSCDLRKAFCTPTHQKTQLVIDVGLPLAGRDSGPTEEDFEARKCLRELLDIVRAHDVKLERLRIIERVRSGQSFLRFNSISGQRTMASHIIKKYGVGLDVENWEFGFGELSDWRLYWYLYEWVGFPTWRAKMIPLVKEDNKEYRAAKLQREQSLEV